MILKILTIQFKMFVSLIFDVFLKINFMNTFEKFQESPLKFLDYKSFLINKKFQ